MAIQNLHTLTKTQFDNLLTQTLGQLEGIKPLAYFDTNTGTLNGLPTIGKGFNLDVVVVRNAVFIQLGLNNAQRLAVTAAIDLAKNDPAIHALPAAQRDAELQNRLQQAYGQPFQMSDTQMATVFANLSQATIDQVRISSGLDWSTELVALVSAKFNGGYGSGITNALAIADPNEARAAVWADLRFLSNANPANDVSKRRYIEATLFGLNGAGFTTNEASANAIYRVYTKNAVSALKYEQFYGGNRLDLANGDLVAIEANVANTPIVAARIANLPRVGTLSAELSDAAMLSNLAAGVVVGKLGTATVNLQELKVAVQAA